MASTTPSAPASAAPHFLEGDATKVAADLFGVALPSAIFLSPLPLFYNAFKHQTPVDMPPLAFTAQFAQCWLWFVYANLKDIPFLIVANVVGLSTAVFYVLLYPYCCKLILLLDPTDLRTPLAAGKPVTTDAVQVEVVASRTSPDAGAAPAPGEAQEHEDRAYDEGERKVSAYLAQYKWQMFGAVLVGAVTTFLLYNKPSVQALGIASSSWLGETAKDSGIGGYIAMTLGTLLLIHPVFTMVEAHATKNADLMGSSLMNGVYTACNVVLLSQGLFFNYNLALAIQSALGLFANITALAVRASIRPAPEVLSAAADGAGATGTREQVRKTD
ncbi:unnamed protein product [Amoebophrya sp. A120]|nr:unnamed protein product [Amoebophrya sp. A120]|eukprot:GSA120T00025786001.1